MRIPMRSQAPSKVPERAFLSAPCCALTTRWPSAIGQCGNQTITLVQYCSAVQRSRPFKRPFWENRPFLAFLITQKKCPDALNASQKTSALFNLRVLKKSRKTLKNTFFCNFGQKHYFFLGFPVFFRSDTFQRAENFCVASSASGRFL